LLVLVLRRGHGQRGKVLRAMDNSGGRVFEHRNALVRQRAHLRDKTRNARERFVRDKTRNARERFVRDKKRNARERFARDKKRNAPDRYVRDSRYYLFRADEMGFAGCIAQPASNLTR